MNQAKAGRSQALCTFLCQEVELSSEVVASLPYLAMDMSIPPSSLLCATLSLEPLNGEFRKR